jgi:hypothetical protein
MNGAGELYLSYGFDHLEVYEYAAVDRQDGILAEVYVMKTTDDAFGLLSMDWGGDPTTIRPSSQRREKTAVAPTARALYGGGLLRLCAGTIYARVMAYRETPESRKAVISLGQRIAADREGSPEPGILRVLPRAVDSLWELRKDRIVYFRSHLVLNSLYYLSHQNVLALDHSAEAVAATYRNLSGTGTPGNVQIVFIRYATPRKAQNALNEFHNAYLQEHQKGFVPGVTDKYTYFFNIEDGWMGYGLHGFCLSLAFECPNRETVQMFLKHLQKD